MTPFWLHSDGQVMFSMLCRVWLIYVFSKLTLVSFEVHFSVLSKNVLYTSALLYWVGQKFRSFFSVILHILQKTPNELNGQLNIHYFLKLSLHGFVILTEQVSSKYF